MGRPAIGGAAARVVREPADWAAAVARLAPSGADDVYFDRCYAALYAGSDGACEAFAFDDGRRAFFLPYIRRPIPATGAGGRFDFESPYGYGGPLADCDDADFLGEAWEAFQEHCVQAGIVAGFVRFHPLLRTHRFAGGARLRVAHERVTVVISLRQTPAQVWAGYAEDNRGRIRKAAASGVTVTGSAGAAAVEAFADLYRRRMTELDAADEYRFDDRYFAGIAALGPDHHRVYLARHGGDVIGGALVLLSARFAHYHLSASPREFFRFAPNNALRHAVIESLLGGPQDVLHFGGGLTRDPGDPLLQFKRKFSRTEADFYVGAYVADEPAYRALCADWERRHPDLTARYGGHVLRYRRV